MVCRLAMCPAASKVGTVLRHRDSRPPSWSSEPSAPLNKSQPGRAATTTIPANGPWQERSAASRASSPVHNPNHKPSPLLRGAGGGRAHAGQGTGPVPVLPDRWSDGSDRKLAMRHHSKFGRFRASGDFGHWLVTDHAVPATPRVE